VVFLSNYHPNQSIMVTWQHTSYHLPNHTVVIVRDSHIVFNSSAVAPPPPPQPPAATQTLAWEWRGERKSASPVDQLQLTNNQGDYAWYSATLSRSSDANDVSEVSLGVEAAGSSHLTLFVNGNKTALGAKVVWPPSGKMHVDVLSSAMGLSNTGSGTTMASETKGVVKVTGKGVSPVSEWTMSYPLRGEADEVFSPSTKVDWSPLTPPPTTPLVWLRGKFDLPSVNTTDPFSWAVQMTGLNKGVLWVNGVCIGRYWLLPGRCDGVCPPPHHGAYCFERWRQGSCDAPTQTLYHIPTELLKPTGNILVAFEETGEVARVERVRIVALTAHPELD